MWRHVTFLKHLVIFCPSLSMAVVSHSTRENTIFDNSRKVRKPCKCTSAKYSSSVDRP